MPRPAVDVVVPFRGTAGELGALELRLSRLRRQPQDTVTVVDNTPQGVGADITGIGVLHATGITVLHAADRATPGYARNRGAELGQAPWLVFFDADTIPAADLLERYFDPVPGEQTALLGGGVEDEPVPPSGPPAARYAQIRAAMSQADTFRLGAWGFAKSANIAVRRAAFEALGGFNESIRAAEDADFSYRLRARGWMIERREDARVVHRSRQTVAGFARQKALHGAGGAWLQSRYPGSFPARRRIGMLWWAVRAALRGLAGSVGRADRDAAGSARPRDRDAVLWALLEPVEGLAWEFGRSLPNERPLTAVIWLRALARLIDFDRSARTQGPPPETWSPSSAEPRRDEMIGA